MKEMKVLQWNAGGKSQTIMLYTEKQQSQTFCCWKFIWASQLIKHVVKKSPQFVDGQYLKLYQPVKACEFSIPPHRPSNTVSHGLLNIHRLHSFILLICIVKIYEYKQQLRNHKYRTKLFLEKNI